MRRFGVLSLAVILALLGALVKVTGILSLDTVVEDARVKFGKKFSSDVVEGNIRAIERAYREVK